MRRSQDWWDIVPFRLVLGALATAGACAAIGLLVPPFSTLAVVLYGTVAVGLMLYGWIGSLAATFEDGPWHGIACLLFPAIYPIYFHATHPESGRKPLVNMVLGFGLAWVAIQTFPMFHRAEAKPARPAVVGRDPLEGVGPSADDPDPPGAPQLIATTNALTRLLAGVTDESSARKAGPLYRQFMAQRRSEFEAAGERRALDDRQALASISALVKLGRRFRETNREFESQWKRVRRTDGLSEILEGKR
jgi:hypothetical protein